MELTLLVERIGKAISDIDASGASFKSFKPGVGPYGEPQLVRAIVESLKAQYADEFASMVCKRVPDALIPGRWALEFKIARPFGDNGREAEHWSQNVLHPYPGNVSALADALKLNALQGPERRAVVLVGFEHRPPIISIEPLCTAFELLADRVINVRLGPRVSTSIGPLIHPVHQQAQVHAWEVRPS